MMPLLHTETCGNPGKPPLLMLHGFMGRGAAFDQLVPFLEDHFYLVMPDLPGHGNSLFNTLPAAARPQNFAQVGEMVLQVMDGLHLESFFLYGYSMGGRVAQQVCLLAPERVSHLFLESAGLGIADASERQTRKAKDDMLLAGILGPADFHRFLVQWHRLPLFCTLTNTSLLSGLMASKQKNDVSELRQALKIMGTGNHDAFGPALAGLNLPITYLYGEKDKKYAKEAAAAKAMIPGLRLCPFPRGSHNLHIQFPAKVAEVLKATLH